MRLNLILGRSGVGKSKYIYSSISKQIGEKKIFLIVPEQANLSAERKLFENSDRNSLIDVEVLTLSRMAYRVASEIGGNLNHLSEAGKDMLIFDILSTENSNLKFLGKTEKNIDIVNRMFTELKKHEISIQKLIDIKTKEEYTNLKLKDIITLYEKYEEKISSNFLDENDSLSILAKNLDKTDMFNNSLIYIDEFLGFTKQEYNIFEKLLQKASSVTVAIPIDELEKNTNKETDIFYFNKLYTNKLIDIAKKYNSEIEIKFLKDNLRFKNEEIKFLEENFDQINKKYENKVNNIKLFLANNPYTEIENVAIHIHSLVKNSGYNYNEIGIIAEDLEKYSEDAKAIFRKFEIPLFIDEKKELNQNILVKFILAMLEIFSNNWSYESVFNYLKTGLLEIGREDIYLLENYCQKWGIKGSKWYNSSFNYETINELQERLENLRNKIVEPLLEFKRRVSNNKTAIQISKEIYNFLIQNNINEILDKKLKKYNEQDISDEYNTSYKLLVGILEDICLIFKDEKMSFDKYKDLLQVGLSSSELGKIPATQDQVIFGDTERTRSNKLKVLFVVGINDGSFPKVNKEEGTGIY